MEERISFENDDDQFVDDIEILEEEIDPDYEPNQNEILEYAEFLGMNLQTDQKFLYIAKEGLKAKLPDNYKPARNSQGEIFYVNLDT